MSYGTSHMTTKKKKSGTKRHISRTKMHRYYIAVKLIKKQQNNDLFPRTQIIGMGLIKDVIIIRRRAVVFTIA